MSPPPSSTLHCSRNVRNYSLIDDLDFMKTWDLLGSTKENDDGNYIEKQTVSVDSYFDAGLNLDSVFKSSTTGQQPTPPCAVKPRQLPKYHLVQMLQQAFGIPDALKRNRFLNAEVGQQITASRSRYKRVSFSKTELTDNHLPNCRRISLKQEFGHIHAPTCRNYVSEQTLNKQDFLIRGNFIRNNAILAKSEQEFYREPPVYTEDCPIIITEHKPTPSLPMNLKHTTMDSINYHDRNSPGLKTSSEVPKFKQPKLTYQPMQWQPIFTDDEIISAPPFVRRPAHSSPVPSRQQVHSDGPAPAPSRQVNSDSPAPTPSRQVNSDSPAPAHSQQKVHSDSDEDDLKEGSRVKGSRDQVTRDQIYSDSDDEDIKDPVKHDQIHSDRDSGFGSMSSDDEDLDFDELVMANSKQFKKPAPQLWFKNSTPSEDPAVVHEEEKLETPKIETRCGYVNPFKNHVAVQDIKIKPPSVLAQLVCDTKHVVMADRRPQPTEDAFLFDTPSPDDLVRSRQALF